MINGNLQDFAASVIARGQISFGDVRRLQRDYLPGGITTRDEAEILIAANDKLVRADKAWAEWLVPALADFVRAQQVSDLSTSDAAGSSLRDLLRASPASAALGRKIARHIRRELAQPPAGESTDAPRRPRRRVRTCKTECAAERPTPIVRSDIVVRPLRRADARPTRRTPCAPSLPYEIWSAGIMEKHLMEKHLRFQLARPPA